MKIDWSALTLPLLSRDMLEQSAQSRTYAYRSLFAVILYAGGLWVYQTSLSEGMASLGVGASVLKRLLYFQSAVTYVLVPFLSGNSISGEKERSTLELLLVTRLSPLQIVLEKFGAQLVPLIIIQFLAFPLFALAYPMGGVSVIDVVGAFSVLVSLSAVTVTWSTICACWSYTSQWALLGYFSFGPLLLLLVPVPGVSNSIRLLIGGTYASSLFVVGMIVLAKLMGEVAEFRRPAGSSESRPAASAKWRAELNDPDIGLWIRAAFAITFPFVLQLQTFLFSSSSSNPSYIISCPMALATCLYFLSVVAPTLLVMRIKAPTNRGPFEISKSVDRAILEINDLVMNSVTVTRPSLDVHEHKPIAWRELRHPAFHIRTVVWGVVGLLFLEAIGVVWGMIPGVTLWQFHRTWSVLYAAAWFASIITILVVSTDLLVKERVRGTLDILLTTPISNKDILRQKMAGLRRWIFAGTIVLLCAWCLRAILLIWICLESHRAVSLRLSLGNLFGSLIGHFSFLWIACWWGLLCSLRIKSPIQSLAVALGGVIGVCLLPWLCVFTNVSTDWLAWLPVTPLSPDEWKTHIEAINPGSAFGVERSAVERLLEFAPLAYVIVLSQFVHLTFDSCLGRIGKRSWWPSQ